MNMTVYQIVDVNHDSAPPNAAQAIESLLQSGYRVAIFRTYLITDRDIEPSLCRGSWGKGSMSGIHLQKVDSFGDVDPRPLYI